MDTYAETKRYIAAGTLFSTLDGPGGRKDETTRIMHDESVTGVIVLVGCAGSASAGAEICYPFYSPFGRLQLPYT